MDRLIVVMGVAGCGKSTVGAALAEALDARFDDGDAFHSPENVEKMRSGQPLTDDDRWPWLDAIGAHFANQSGRAIVASSALKRAYRDRIAAATGAPVLYIHLDGPFDLIAERMAARQGHYMPTALLQSQFDALEPIAPDENAIVVSVAGSPETILSEIHERLTAREA